MSLKFVPKGHINNKAPLVHEMVWHRTGDKPLHEPMFIQFTKCNKTSAMIYNIHNNLRQVIWSGIKHEMINM